jgi:hypothetical protein
MHAASQLLAAASVPNPKTHRARKRMSLWAALVSTAVANAAASPSPPDALECGYRKEMFAQAQARLAKGTTPGTARDVFDALELGTMCGEQPPRPPAGARGKVVAAANDVDAARSVFVGLDAYPTVPTALAAVRASGGAKDTIVLKDGIHYLNQTMTLGPSDSGITIRAAPGATPWLSGGQPLGDSLAWSKVEGHPSGVAVWSASLKGTGIKKVPGLFGIKSHNRYVRARFPNANPEHACWGYSCPDKDTWSLNSDQVTSHLHCMRACHGCPAPPPGANRPLNWIWSAWLRLRSGIGQRWANRPRLAPLTSPRCPTPPA